MREIDRFAGFRRGMGIGGGVADQLQTFQRAPGSVAPPHHRRRHGALRKLHHRRGYPKNRLVGDGSRPPRIRSDRAGIRAGSPARTALPENRRISRLVSEIPTERRTEPPQGDRQLLRHRRTGHPAGRRRAPGALHQSLAGDRTALASGGFRRLRTAQ